MKFEGAAQLNMTLRSEPTHQASKEQLSSGEMLCRGYASPPVLEAQRQLQPHGKINPLSRCHTRLILHSHPPPPVFAPVILQHYSLASLCQKNLKAQGSIPYKRNEENCAILHQQWRERRVSINYTCNTGWG